MSNPLNSTQNSPASWSRAVAAEFGSDPQHPRDAQRLPHAPSPVSGSFRAHPQESHESPAGLPFFEGISPEGGQLDPIGETPLAVFGRIVTEMEEARRHGGDRTADLDPPPDDPAPDDPAPRAHAPRDEGEARGAMRGLSAIITTAIRLLTRRSRRAPPSTTDAEPRPPAE